MKSGGRTGNDRYEGFVVDLAGDIAERVGFNFTIQITEGYGSVDETGHWNGMIRQLLEEVHYFCLPILYTMLIEKQLFLLAMTIVVSTRKEERRTTTFVSHCNRRMFWVS